MSVLVTSVAPGDGGRLREDARAVGSTIVDLRLARAVLVAERLVVDAHAGGDRQPVRASSDPARRTRSADRCSATSATVARSRCSRPVSAKRMRSGAAPARGYE